MISMTTAAAKRPQLAHLTAQLDDLRQRGTYFKLRELDDQQAPVCTYDGKRVINLASNNYLGLCNHPKLEEAAIAATKKFGVGSGAVRTIAGTMHIHMELEEKIAAFKGVEACVVFQSGFAANAGTVSSILGKEDFIISDELNHASIIDGARLSRAKIKVFRHKDAAHCEELLREVQNEPGHKLIISDGVFSMDGDIGPVDKLAALAEKYNAIMMVDDAHASGVLGRNGRGSVDHFHMTDKVDVQVGTLSKGHRRPRRLCLREAVISSTTSTTAPAISLLYLTPAFSRRNLHRCLRHPRKRTRSHPASLDNTNYFKKQLSDAGFDVGGRTTPASETPITPIIIGDGRKTMDFSRALFDAGVMATGIAFPTVPEGKAPYSHHHDQRTHAHTNRSGLGNLQHGCKKDRYSKHLITDAESKITTVNRLFPSDCIRLRSILTRMRLLHCIPFCTPSRMRRSRLTFAVAFVLATPGAPRILCAQQLDLSPATSSSIESAAVASPELPDAPSALLYPQAGQTPAPNAAQQTPPPSQQTTNPDAVSANGAQQTKRVLGIIPNFRLRLRRHQTAPRKHQNKS